MLIMIILVFLVGCQNQNLLDSEQKTPILTETPTTNKTEDISNTYIETFEISELFGESELGKAVSREIGGKDMVTKDELDAIVDLNKTFKLYELQGIRYLENLKKLEVNIYSLDDYEDIAEIIDELSSLDKLEEIEIDCAEFSSAHRVVSEFVKAIENTESIDKINFVNWKIIDTELLENFDKVKTIEIHLPDTYVESIDLSGLVYMDDLKTLDIRATESIQNLTGIEKLTNLRKLKLFSNDIRDLTAISNLTELEYLDLCGNPNLPTSEYIKLGSLKKLKVLEIGVREDNDIAIDLAFLEELDMLEELLVTGSNIEGIDTISSLSALIRLEIYFFKCEDLSFVNGLDKVEYVGLEHTSLYDISVLLDLSNLKTLNISGSVLENEQVIEAINELREKGIEILD